MASVNPSYPTKFHSEEELRLMLQVAQRTLLRLEGKAPDKNFCPVVELWQGYNVALATIGLKIAFELRKRGKAASLSFFAMRITEVDFDIPEWL